MPELPEVETVARALQTLVAGCTIERAELRRARLAPDTTPLAFANRLKGATINFVHRRGKHILIDLTGDKTLIVHLRMSGRFLLLPEEIEDPKFTHAVLYFAGGRRLVFDDQRHFGLMKIVRTTELSDAKELKKLAPEPFSEDFSVTYLATLSRASKRSLKEFLLDQTRVTGLGNIYASEAMFLAGVHPAVRTHKLSKPRIARLHACIVNVLAEAIAHAEKIVPDPENLEGGYFSGSDGGWLVYDREGEPCRTCGTEIRRITQGGRSTYFCQRCQRR
ncbi:MAG: bifunctional DNA-formamidopyrimidine glycosylase/DNA-(apurinic or apyrimidinic site) lyase [Acidobacteria bacterium]|nr:bifunctional DNA-formamidopyrimidine glycosylase/DNA-(apurinic or apyrimidinic site) lyase [Acidobacteriota bacterium]